MTNKELDALGTEIAYLRYQIERLVRAGLPTELAIKTAINLRKDMEPYDENVIKEVVDFIKLVNPSIELDESESFRR